MNNLFINKYEILKTKFKVGSIVHSKIIKKIDSNKAIATINGYNVVIKSDTELINNKRIPYFISGFNDKEKIIILKKIKFFHQNYPEANLNTKYLENILKKLNLPVNSKTIEIAHILELNEKRIDKELLIKILNFSKIFYQPELIYKLLKLNFLEKIIINFLLLFKNFTSNKKNKNSENKNSKLHINDYDSLDEIKDKLKVLLKPVDLLKMDKKAILLFIYYALTSETWKNFLIPLNNGKNGILKLKQENNNIYLRINIPTRKGEFIYNISYYKELEKIFISIEVNSKIMIKKIKKELNSLKKELKKFTVEFKIKNINITEIEENFNLYI